MPLSFVDLPTQTKAIVLNKEEKNFLNYLKQLENEADEMNSDYSVTIDINVNFTQSKAKDAPSVRIVDSEDPNVMEVRMIEKDIREEYSWDYDKLTQKCRERYSDFILNQKYHNIRKSLYKNIKFCHTRYLDPGNPKSSEKMFFRPNILNEFDKHYSKKEK